MLRTPLEVAAIQCEKWFDGWNSDDIGWVIVFIVIVAIGTFGQIWKAR